MIAITERSVGLWFVALTAESDWIAHIEEIDPEKEYRLVYRFRAYMDNKAFESKDEKRWYVVNGRSTRAYAIASLRDVARSLLDNGATGPSYEYLNDAGDPQAFMRKLQDAPFVFIRQVAKADQAEVLAELDRVRDLLIKEREGL